MTSGVYQHPVVEKALIVLKRDPVPVGDSLRVHLASEFPSWRKKQLVFRGRIADEKER